MMDGDDVLSKAVENVTMVSSPHKSLAYRYANIHGYISVCVCAFGIVANFFNVNVLTRKNMRTHTNYILTWLAVSDTITMVSYVSFALHFYCLYPPGEISAEKNNLQWMTFMLLHVSLSVTTHTASTWLCVALAIIRYLDIRNPTKGHASRRRRMCHAKRIILTISFASVLTLIPNYVSNRLEGIDVNGTTIYMFKDTKLGTGEADQTFLVNIWVYSVAGKIIPCILMCTFGALLIYTMHIKTRRRRKCLAISSVGSHRLIVYSRATKMLVTIIVLFLVTEFPQGVLLILSAVVPQFFETIYQSFGDVMDIVALISNAVNFVLYCFMSAAFRKTFFKVYRHFPVKRTNPGVNSNPNSPHSQALFKSFPN